MTTTGPLKPQPVDLARSQVQRAHADCAAAWRSSAAISVILFFTVIMAWGIPFVLAATGVANGRRMRDARAGRYDDEPVTASDRRLALRWTAATLLALVALGMVAIFLRGGVWTVAGVGVVFALAAAALVPWRTIRR